MVFRRQRSVPAAGRLRNGKLPRWTAPRSSQREPWRRVGRVLPPEPGGNAAARPPNGRAHPRSAAAGRGRLRRVTSNPSGETLSNAPLLQRQSFYLRPDPGRVLVRPFKISAEPRDRTPTDTRRVSRIVGRVLALDPQSAESQLAQVLEHLRGRHRHLAATLDARADAMEAALAAHGAFTSTQRQLIGAYFLHEYSFEAVALFNPSIVAHPDQTCAPPGGRRFILSLRAIGEGHVSSLTFRSGSIAANGAVTVDPTARLASIPRLQRRIESEREDCIELEFAPEEDISERVIFPITDAQSNGIEDARFVEFDDHGRRVFYATYTAYNGSSIRSEMIETADFLRFRMTPL